MAKITRLDCEKCGVPTPIARLVFRSSDCGGTQCVWCYRNKGEVNPFKVVPTKETPKEKKVEKKKVKNKVEIKVIKAKKTTKKK